MVGSVKLITVIFLAITALSSSAVILGQSTLKPANFRVAFARTGSGSRYRATSVLCDIIFSYAGFTKVLTLFTR